MSIRDKMLRAYFKVAEKVGEDTAIVKSASLFHRNKRYAFFVEARRLDKDGNLPGEGLIKL
jgi:hypothetical protein